MAKRIGIVTFHRAHNAGAMLQAYALQHVIRSLGHECFFVESGGLQGGRAWPMLRTVKDVAIYPARFLNMLGFAQLKAGRFNAFRERQLTEKILRLTDLDLKGALDVLVVGSDQVWNPEIGFRTKSVYLLEGVTSQVKKMSYAASFGVTQLPKGQFDRYRTALSRFDAISVREEAGAEIVKSLIGRRPQVVVDPTMLLEREDYATIESSRLKTGPYVCSYCPSENDELYRFSLRVANHLKLPLVNIQNGRMGWLGCHWGDWRATSPDRFLSLIKHSACVVTDSVHASVFSIIYRRPFWTYRNGNGAAVGSRLETLLFSLGLESHYVSSDHVLPTSVNDMVWDYDAVGVRLGELRQASLDYLKGELAE